MKKNRREIQIMKRFTIITVCLNAAADLDDTILSVLNQDWDDFEYLIKDGCSNDDTLKIAESYASAFAERKIPYRILSQPDSGIYDAMNQAAQTAQGEWLLYMNAGDRLADKTVLSLVAKSGKLESAEIVYGDRIFNDHNLYLYGKARALEEIRFGLPFGHQSAFTRKELLEEVPYSLQYRICSDYRFYLQMYTEGKKFAYIPMAISIFDVNGISSNAMLIHKDKLSVYMEMPIRDEEAIQREKNLLKKNEQQAFWHAHLWKYVPKRIRMLRRMRMRKKAGWKTEKEFFRERERISENA